MSLALSEILFKGSGDVSLDRARRTHGHHGLTLSIASNMGPEEPIASSASALIAKPLVLSNGERGGTFALWHALAREMPIGGRFEVHTKGNVSHGFRMLCTPEDVSMEPFPERGVSLLDLMCEIPGLSKFLSTRGVSSKLVRGTMTGMFNTDKLESELRLVIHPDSKPILDAVYDKVLIHPRSICNTEISELTSGVSIKIKSPRGEEVRFRIPHTAQTAEDRLWFTPNKYINE
ncbi:MAG: hypothetical protein EOP04_33655, partial [Proteobacteria bacterium]